MSVQLESQIQIVPEGTPNPNCTRYAVNHKLLDGAGLDFPAKDAAEKSPLARELFRLPNVSGVYIGPNFITVSISVGGDWALRPLVIQAITDHIQSGNPIVGEGVAPALPKVAATATEAGIIHILETEIQPAVAMDGGYICFAGYENNIVKVQLRGSCHSCPSAIYTLKAGIENRLKQEFPEIVGVEAV